MCRQNFLLIILFGSSKIAEVFIVKNCRGFVTSLFYNLLEVYLCKENEEIPTEKSIYKIYSQPTWYIDVYNFLMS